MYYPVFAPVLFDYKSPPGRENPLRFGLHSSLPPFIPLPNNAVKTAKLWFRGSRFGWEARGRNGARTQVSPRWPCLPLSLVALHESSLMYQLGCTGLPATENPSHTCSGNWKPRGWTASGSARQQLCALSPLPSCFSPSSVCCLHFQAGFPHAGVTYCTPDATSTRHSVQRKEILFLCPFYK